MLPALLTTLLWALSTLFAQRSLRAVGATRANIGRLVVAFVVLGTIAHLFGGGMGGSGRNWLLLSGVIGMGFGDLAFFGALPRLGSRLTVLISQCLAAPLAALVEWLWLGTQPTLSQLLLGAVILLGVAIALAPGKGENNAMKLKPLGLLFGFAAAAGQAVGAVISRKANLCALASGENINGFTAAYQRIAGGLVITAAYFIIKAIIDNRRGNHTGDAPADICWKSYLWIPANAGCGAILGVSSYQWALFTTPSAIVMPIVALTPLVIIPFTYFFEQERPTKRSLLGGVIAVAATVALALAK